MDRPAGIIGNPTVSRPKFRQLDCISVDDSFSIDRHNHLQLQRISKWMETGEAGHV